MTSASITWSETINEVLDQHEVKVPVADILLWEQPKKSAMWFGVGVSLYLLVDVFAIGLTTTIGSIAILQLLVFRISSFLQERGMAFENVDLKETLVLTPSPENVSKTIEIIGNSIRIMEESVNELCLSSDYFRLAQAFSGFLFLSALGRVVTLPVLLLACWVISFTLPALYVHNQEYIDNALDKSMEVTEVMVNAATERKESRLR